MNIGILVSDFPPNKIGGTEIQSFNIAKRLAKKHSVTVFTRHYRGLLREEKEYGFLIKRFSCIKVPGFRFLSHIFFSIIMIQKENLDVLQCMMLTPNGLVGVLCRRLFRTKAIPWVRGGDWYIARKGILGGRIVSFVIRKSPVIFTQTKGTKTEILRKSPGRNIKVMPNGIELKGRQASGNRVVFVGNLIERKGIEYLIEAMRGLDAELLVVGDGPRRTFLEGMAGDNVRFVGGVKPEEVEGYMRQGSIFVLPSVRGEGFPNAILEAMSVGLPVVATKLAGIPDIIEHGKTGFLAEPGNPEQLRKYIKRLLDDSKLRKRISKNCLIEVKKYSWKAMIDRLEKAYIEVSRCVG
jgi:glycosyltransferase involved in cell wall biosynthesis